MSALQRLTTEYIEAEDRIRISGEGSQGEFLTFWLTQRLLIRLIRFIVSAIEEIPKQAKSSSAIDARTTALVNELAQEAAAQSIVPARPVDATRSGATWLVHEIDINKTQQHFTLRFKCTECPPADVTFDQQQLRQWLIIVHKLWQQAEWSLAVWPDWILNTATTPLKKIPGSAVH